MSQDVYIACPTDAAGEPDWDKAQAFSDETAAVAACLDDKWLMAKIEEGAIATLDSADYHYFPLRKGSSPSSP